MSEILNELKREVENNRSEFQSLTKTGSTQELYAALQNLASKVGDKYKIRIELSFPEKDSILDFNSYGTKNVSFFIEKGRKHFHGVTADDVRRQVQQLFPYATIVPTRFGYEGWRVQTNMGRIDILGGALHVWCPITDEVAQLVDWLFVNTYRE